MGSGCAVYSGFLCFISFPECAAGGTAPPTFQTPFFYRWSVKELDVENCENCKAKPCKEPESVPYIVHEASMARMERQAKRLWIAVLLLIALLVGTNAAWLYYDSQFSDIVTTIEAEQDGSGVNIVSGRDLDYGAEGKDNNP